VAEALRERGLHTANQVTDPGASRVELDVVGFTPGMETVHAVEVKREATDALLHQCEDRLRYAPLVSAAVPAGEADRLVEKTRGPDAAAPATRLGVVVVDEAGARFLEDPVAAPDEVEPGRRNMLERVLREALAEGRAEAPG
jgi:hypothetical protein